VTYDDVRDQEMACATCDREEAIVRLTLDSVTGRRFAFAIGKMCALELEGTLRGFRKWSVRGGSKQGQRRMARIAEGP
jgi:hypothetical protein